jgi:hypothetical protein
LRSAAVGSETRQDVGVESLDHRLADLGGGSGSLLVALAVALLLGLRHATDPDHLTALSALVLADGERGARPAGRLGLAWGAGHAMTLLALGLPVLLAGEAMPGWAQRGAEAVVAVVILALAVRLLVRGHAPARAGDTARTRSPRAAFGIGAVHGAGGSAGVGILLLAGLHGGAESVAALVLFALGTACSMALASAAWGRVLAGGAVERRLPLLAPAFGAAGLAFGCWYGAMAAMG